MVVGKKEKSDVKYQRDAVLMLKGKKYNKTVYGDKKTPNRRDVFVGNIKTNLPKSATIEWMGKKYNAKLSFRYGQGGSRIPVYTWRV